MHHEHKHKKCTVLKYVLVIDLSFVDPTLRTVRRMIPSLDNSLDCQQFFKNLDRSRRREGRRVHMSGVTSS